jgi:hypothetical protein
MATKTRKQSSEVIIIDITSLVRRRWKLHNGRGVFVQSGVGHMQGVRRREDGGLLNAWLRFLPVQTTVVCCPSQNGPHRKGVKRENTGGGGTIHK